MKLFWQNIFFFTFLTFFVNKNEIAHYEKSI